MINMDFYDANDDEVNRITGRLDRLDPNPFTITHPEPYARPAIPLNFTNEQIAELRGVCFTDPLNFPNTNEKKPGWTSKMSYSCSMSKIDFAKIVVNTVLIAGWLAFFALIVSGSITQIEKVDRTNNWTILTFIFMILVIATVFVRRLCSRHNNKCESSSKASHFSLCHWRLPCFHGAKDEETSMLYSVKT